MPKNSMTTAALNRAIGERDRVITGLYLLLAELGVSEELAWTRAEELLAAQHHATGDGRGERRNA